MRGLSELLVSRLIVWGWWIAVAAILILVGLVLAFG